MVGHFIPVLNSRKHLFLFSEITQSYEATNPNPPLPISPISKPGPEENEMPGFHLNLYEIIIQ